jgi:hypothetical protein
MTEERWLPVAGYEGAYEVSDLGRVRSIDRVITRNGRPALLRGTVLKPNPVPPTGYLAVNIWRNGKCKMGRIHVLVLEAFVGPRPAIDIEGCHGNGDHHDNRLANLRWDTKKANAQDTLSHGRNPQASKMHCKRGHEFTKLNTRYTTTGGRQCRECKRLREGSIGRRGPYGSKYDRSSPAK